MMKRVTKQSRLANGLRAALVAGIVGLTPAAAGAATAADAGSAVADTASRQETPVRASGLVDIPAPGLSPGLPPPQLSALSDRRIVAGLLLVLFAGLSGITVSMWRELGRKAGR